MKLFPFSTGLVAAIALSGIIFTPTLQAQAVEECSSTELKRYLVRSNIVYGQWVDTGITEGDLKHQTRTQNFDLDTKILHTDGCIETVVHGEGSDIDERWTKE